MAITSHCAVWPPISTCSTDQSVVLQRDIAGAAAMLHAEGNMMLELARAAAAFTVASRDSSASPFLGLTAYHLRGDGSGPASTTPAGIGNRPAASDRRNAIFVNGRADFGGPQPAGGAPQRQVCHRHRGM